MVNRTSGKLLGLLCIIVAVSCVSAAEDVYDRSHPLGLDYWHPYGRFSMDFETPHIKWTKPLAGGEIKAMVCFLILDPIYLILANSGLGMS